MIRRLNPCSEAMEWAEKYVDPQLAWNECPRAGWMLWLLGNAVDVDHRQLVAAAIGCARLSLPFTTDQRVSLALDCVEQWISKQATLDDVRSAKAAAEKAAAEAAARAAAWTAMAAARAAMAAARAAARAAETAETAETAGTAETAESAARAAAETARAAAWTAGTAAGTAADAAAANEVRRCFPVPPVSFRQ